MFPIQMETFPIQMKMFLNLLETNVAPKIFGGGREIIILTLLLTDVCDRIPLWWSEITWRKTQGHVSQISFF